MKSNTVKILGLAATILGAGLTILNGWVDDKKMEERIELGIDKALADRESETES